VRVGIGYDIHRLVPGRELFLGGVKVPFHLGLEGYSDADVLLHAICDALLGAAGEGDIGQHFPPGDERYLNVSSLKLLGEVRKIVAPRFVVSNVDAVIIAEKPRLTPYVGEMKEKIKVCLSLESIKDINIKATTSEGLGAVGRGEAIAAYAAVCLLSK